MPEINGRRFDNAMHNSQESGCSKTIKERGHVAGNLVDGYVDYKGVRRHVKKYDRVLWGIGIGVEENESSVNGNMFRRQVRHFIAKARSAKEGPDFGLKPKIFMPSSRPWRLAVQASLFTPVIPRLLSALCNDRPLRFPRAPSSSARNPCSTGSSPRPYNAR